MRYKTVGFTLIELLIVVSMIAILAFLLIPVILGAQKRAYDTAARACAKSIQTAQAASWVDTKKYMVIGSSSGRINKITDGIDSSCEHNKIYFVDRSTEDDLITTYKIDIWDERGTSVITVTPTNIEANATGATVFSSRGV